MQVAYAFNMEGESLRRARRRQKLEALLTEVGGAAQAEIDTGTPRTHFVALVKGRRGLGDDLAEKLEKVYGKPAGWFDAVESAQAVWPFSIELQNQVLSMGPEDLRFMEKAMWSHLKMDVPESLHYGSPVTGDMAQPSTVNLLGSSDAQRAKKST